MSPTKLNAISLYTNFIVLALLGLFANPILLHAIGAENFGIWRSCLRILDISSVADGRATQALKWIIAHRDSDTDDEQKRRDVGASIAIWMLWLPVLLISLALTIYYLPWLITGIPNDKLGVVRVAAILLSINVALMALTTIPDAVLAGTNQGYRSYFISTIILVLSNLLAIFLAYQNLGLIGLAAATLFGQILTGVIVYFIARSHVGWWGVLMPNVTDIRRIFSFSNLTLLWSFIQLLMLSSEILLISYFLGPTDVSRYTFTAYVAQFALSICLMTGSAITPRLGSLVGAKKIGEAQTLYSQTREVVVFLGTLSSAGIILSNQAFVDIWVGDAYFLGDYANLFMSIILLQLVLIRFDAQVQDVGLDIGLKVALGGISAVSSLLLSALIYYLTHNISLIFVGIILGRLPLSFMFPRLVKRMLPTASGTTDFFPPALIIIGIIFLISQFWKPHGFFGFLSATVATIVIVTGCSFLMIFSRQNRRRVIHATIQIWRKISKVRGNE